MKRVDFGNAFECDPYLTRDLWIKHTTFKDWQRVYDFLKEVYPLKYVIDEETMPLPADIGTAFERTGYVDFKYLYITVGSLTLRTYFSDNAVIDFDFDQCQIITDEQLQPLLVFIEAIARLVDKEVICSEELYPYVIYFSFDPTTGQFKVL